MESAYENIKLNMDSLSATEKKAATFLVENIERIHSLNVVKIAKESQTSEATVVRMSKKLGYKGFYQLKVMLIHSIDKAQQFPTDSPLSNLNDFFQATAQNMLHIGNVVDEEVFWKCVDLIANANTVHVIASGNTIPSVLEFCFRLGRIGVATTNSISDELELANIDLARYGDIVIGVSHSGGSKNVVKAFELARKKGVSTLAVTDITTSPLKKHADFALASTIESSSTSVFGAESHIYTSIILDALVFFVANKKRTPQGVKMFLAEAQVR
ncbi:MurR/RpiR family transcriptional regulator [Anaerotignum sp. MB30-C6]|uniref:MurR/RpiR family transcriptional regulator n=1 Tax=Anaerotignum sp. MB30-C6 TaxID=3070814 RepID=UPI0027DD2AA7|nr:MurR/RpiR family transcriptional regulator [Anaerotignum sp. MB30-C6]WMI82693.1 MurR/RpiR family transcriptional regulator [Anaerotignum sp. MB30-C6]